MDYFCVHVYRTFRSDTEQRSGSVLGNSKKGVLWQSGKGILTLLLRLFSVRCSFLQDDLTVSALSSSVVFVVMRLVLRYREGPV